MPFTQVTTCLICEGARQELGGKYNLLGFYGVAPNVNVSIIDFNLPVTLCLFFVGGPGSGQFHVGLRLTAQSGEVVPLPPSAELDVNLITGKRITYLILVINQRLPGPGRYRAELVVNGAPGFAAEFELAQGSVAQMRTQYPGEVSE
jgi:hypothetical protein